MQRTADAAPTMAHTHSAYVEGCFRCDLSREEARSVERIPPHLDPTPLLDAIEARGGLHALFPHAERIVKTRTTKSADSSRPKIAPEEVTRFNTTRDTLRRCRNRGWISHEMADHLCVTLLGSHPYVVYGDAWWTEDEDDEQTP